MLIKAVSVDVNNREKLNKAVSAVFAENLCASLRMLFELITHKKNHTLHEQSNLV